MGLGPWAQADLIREIQQSERTRFRRALRMARKEAEGDGRYGRQTNVSRMLDLIEQRAIPKRKKQKKGTLGMSRVMPTGHEAGQGRSDG